MSASVVARWNDLALEVVRAGPPAPTVISRALHIAHSAMYDAWAAYDADAAGAYFRGIATGPDSEAAREVAVSHAAFAALTALFPAGRAVFAEFMAELGLDAQDTGRSLSSAEGVGNAAAAAVLAARAEDGANAQGGYADTTGYASVNSDDGVSGADGGAFDPNHWAPLRVPTGAITDENGTPIVTDDPASYRVQVPVTPQWGSVEPFGLADIDSYLPPAPPKLGDFSQYIDATGKVTTGDAAYREQFGALVAISAGLTAEQKAIAEYWADGPQSSTPPGHWNEFAQDIALRDGHSLGDDVKFFFALNNALFDAGIATWNTKFTYDFIRPQSAIRYLYAGQEILSWAGPDHGAALVAGEEWQPYQSVTFVTPAFPEFTSGHSAFSYAAATVIAEFAGTDALFDGVSRGAYDLDGDGLADLLGQYVATGLAFEGYEGEPITLQWETVWEAAAEAGYSRLLGGIHIQDGDLYGRALGAAVAADAWQATSALFIQDAVPDARDDEATTDEDSAIKIDLLANDEAPSGAVLAVGAPEHGNVTDHGNGTVTYVPDADFFGTDSFTYSLGGDVATVSIAVNPVNDAPEIVAFAPLPISEDDAAQRFLAADFCYDADGDPLALVALSANWSGGALDVEIDGDGFRFDPGQLGEALAAGQSAEVDVSITLSDGLAEVTGSVHLTVRGADEAMNPVLGTDGRDNINGTEGADVIFSGAGTYDRMTGGGGADLFVFGEECANGVRERDVIVDFEVGIDRMLLPDAPYHVHATSSALLLTIGNDGDRVYILGSGITEADLGLQFGDWAGV